jgi:hypothetical protein
VNTPMTAMVAAAPQGARLRLTRAHPVR